MSDAIIYKTQILGWIHSFTGDGSNKFIVVMDGLKSLDAMCKLPDDEPISVEGMPPMNCKMLKEEILARTKRIYLSEHEYLLDRS